MQADSNRYIANFHANAIYGGGGGARGSPGSQWGVGPYVAGIEKLAESNGTLRVPPRLPGYHPGGRSKNFQA